MFRNHPPQMTKKGRFSRLFELNGCSLCVVDQSQNLVGTTLQIWATFDIVTQIRKVFFFFMYKKLFFILVRKETMLAELV